MGVNGLSIYFRRKKNGDALDRCRTLTKNLYELSRTAYDQFFSFRLTYNECLLIFRNVCTEKKKYKFLLLSYDD